MRCLFVLMPVLFGAIASAQAMTEVGASAAGSAIGSAAGKKVSEGISSIFGKLDKTTARAAKAPEDNSKSDPLLEVGAGVPRVSTHESVPPPPPPAGHHARAPKPPVHETFAAVPPPPPPPPPPVTTDDLKKVASGMNREELLKLGTPASRISMSDDGHLSETYSYTDKDNWIGRVRLVDGAVSSVELRRGS